VDTDADASTYDDEDDDASEAASNAPAHGALVVQTESDDASGESQQVRFDVIRHAGCLWLRPQA